MALAEHVAAWSKDPSTRVGCVIVDRHKLVRAMGYNGFPRGVRDTRARLEDRSTKNLLMMHAEANAVMNATADLRGCVAYVTHRPCASCAGILIQAGITQIVTRRPDPAFADRWAESIAAADMALEDARVSLVYY